MLMTGAEVFLMRSPVLFHTRANSCEFNASFPPEMVLGYHGTRYWAELIPGVPTQCPTSSTLPEQNAFQGVDDSKGRRSTGAPQPIAQHRRSVASTFGSPSVFEHHLSVSSVLTVRLWQSVGKKG
ncbi:unnamed protein product, partial [Ostreobium quekettii]